MKIALAMIVAPRDEEVGPLARCLRNIHSHVDAIYITQAGPKPHKEISELCELYNASESFYEWDNNFANARNFNFSQVPKDYDYIFWLDADDMVRSPEKIKDTIAEHPNVDTFSLWYVYAFDEFKNPVVVHHKTRIVRNDGCVEWMGALHEDFKANRILEQFHIEGIEVFHLSNEARFADAKERNVRVAEAAIDENDPRTYWNLANSLKGVGKDKEAIEQFDLFLEKSKSDDEKYIARLRRAEAFWSLGETKKAIEEAQYAVGLKPHYPDAYYLLGSLYFNQEKYPDAADMLLAGLQKKKPYHQIIVYNPRDYDFNPMMHLAKCYFQMHRPDLALPLLEGCSKIRPTDKGLKDLVAKMKKEVAVFDKMLKAVDKLTKIKDKTKLKKALDALPEDIASHPQVCLIRNTNFVKEETSGRDLVYFCGYTEEEWTPETAKTKGIGGSEEAVIHLTQRFVKQGWNVTVYNNCGHKDLEFDGVKYRPFWTWNPRDRQDVTILWRAPRFAGYDINSDKIFLDMHDVVQPGEFNEERLSNIDKIFVKSNFHRSLFAHVPDEKFVVVPNGIAPEDFMESKRDPLLVINTSSPDRSLSSFIEIAGKIRERVIGARFVWAYGWGVYDIVHKDEPEKMDWKREQIKRMEAVGVENLGRISHGEIAELYRNANVFLYPTEFAEIDCISLTKAMAGGAIPVTTDFAALGEKQGHGGFFFHSAKTKDSWDNGFDYAYKDTDGMVEAVVELLQNPPLEREEMREWARRTYSWDTISETWLKHCETTSQDSTT